MRHNGLQTSNLVMTRDLGLLPQLLATAKLKSLNVEKVSLGIKRRPEAKMYRNAPSKRQKPLTQDGHYRCQFCELSYTQKASLTRHAKKAHSKELRDSEIIAKTETKPEEKIYVGPEHTPEIKSATESHDLSEKNESLDDVNSLEDENSVENENSVAKKSAKQHS